MKNGLEYIFLGLLRILIQVDAQHFFYRRRSLHLFSSHGSFPFRWAAIGLLSLPN
jgi:hypothetical protein